MQSYEQWEYVGNCIYCGASCYTKDGEFKSTTNMDCLCEVEDGHS